jgi:hypothetical protein
MAKPIKNWGGSIKNTDGSYSSLLKLADWEDGGRTLTIFAKELLALAEKLKNDPNIAKDGKYINISLKEFGDKGGAPKVANIHDAPRGIDNVKSDDCPF